MSFEGEQLNVAELDFQQIKSNLIDYIQNSDTEFSDWNFDGSNLNALMDVLAYNTHYNAMLAYMAVNESFIDSAQLRSSIAAMAKMLGYTPRSFSAPKAIFKGGSDGARFRAASGNTPSSFSLEKGTRFTTSSQIGAFQFIVMDDHIRLIKDPEDTNYYITEPDYPIVVYQGRRIITEYIANGADDSQRYLIPEFNVDISTLKVTVYNTAQKQKEVRYEKISEYTTNPQKGFRFS